MQTQTEWKGAGELPEVVIEEGRASLHRISHRAAVHLGHVFAGEARLPVVVQKLAEQLFGRRMRPRDFPLADGTVLEAAAQELPPPINRQAVVSAGNGADPAGGVIQKMPGAFERA